MAGLAEGGERRERESVMMADSLENLKHHFEDDGFATVNGMRLLELRPGFAKTCLAVAERHANNVGMVHGGAIFTLAAFAFGAASRTAGLATVGVSSSISFLRPTRSGTLYAEATEVSRSRKLSVCTVEVSNDAGELVALFQGTAYIKDQPFPMGGGIEPKEGGHNADL
jgi:acyl-CoA thioesterase